MMEFCDELLLAASSAGLIYTRERLYINCCNREIIGYTSWEWSCSFLKSKFSFAARSRADARR